MEVGVGGGYHDLLKFADQLAQLPRLVTLNEVKVQARQRARYRGRPSGLAAPTVAGEHARRSRRGGLPGHARSRCGGDARAGRGPAAGQALAGHDGGDDAPSRLVPVGVERAPAGDGRRREPPGGRGVGPVPAEVPDAAACAEGARAERGAAGSGARAGARGSGGRRAGAHGGPGTRSSPWCGRSIRGRSGRLRRSRASSSWASSGIRRTPEAIRALVETPDGLGYYLRLNEEKFGGKVVALERDRVRFVIREESRESARGSGPSSSGCRSRTDSRKASGYRGPIATVEDGGERRG